MADMELDLEASAYFWWLSKQPLAYSIDMHAENPTVNCSTDAEKRLARAVAIRFAKYAGEGGERG